MSDFWDLTFRFFSMVDANVRWVAAGSILLGAASGGLGSFAYLQKRSLLGDALAHAALPGVALAFMVTGQKDFLALLLGAAISGWIGAVAVTAITRHSKIKQDAALGIVLTAFFGLGIVLLTHIQKSGSGSQSGLDKFLFGQAAAMGRQDVVILAIVAISMLAVLAVGFRHFKIMAFDPGYGRSIGVRVGLLQIIMTTMLVFAVTIGLQAVGVVLMAAMLITPAAAARQWTDRLWLMIGLASVFGAGSGLFGAYVSFLAPRLPTGPWMVVVVSTVFAVSILFAPKRGLMARVRRHRSHRRKIIRENILKALFKPGFENRDWSRCCSISNLEEIWSFTRSELSSGLRTLKRRGLIEEHNQVYRLTSGGVAEGARVTRLHRLWELYLTQYLDLAGDHVHRDAEDIEHIITPEMEKQLEAALDKPRFDPHNREIPYIDREETV